VLCVGAVVAPLAGAAWAGGDPETGTTTIPASDATEFIVGTLVDSKGTSDRSDNEPVAGARVRVTNADDSVVAEIETDDQGRFEVPLPGPGTYVVTLDVDTLPKGVALAAGAESRTVTVDGGERQRVLYDLGARTRRTTSTFARFLQLSVEGIKFGFIIAITSVGLSLIFGTTGLTNFAHGEMVTFGAIVAYYINVEGGVQLIPATMLAMVVGAGGGAVLERGLWRPLRHRGVGLLAMMIVSIGLSLLLRNLWLYWFGGGGRFFADYVAQRAIKIGSVSIAPRDLWGIAISLVVLVLVALALERTRFGKATRAVADNPELAASSGIDVDRVILVVWMAGGALATLGGVLYAVGQQVSFTFGFDLLLLMFAGVTLGGLGTAYGALVGSFIIGWVTSVSTLWIRPDLKYVTALGVLILILMIRPQGILGRAERVG
jgi:branched-chain amino acid transport system permease protein